MVVESGTKNKNVNIQKFNPCAGEHLQHDDDQLTEGRRPERDAVVGHLLHLLRLRGPL